MKIAYSSNFIGNAEGTSQTVLIQWTEGGNGFPGRTFLPLFRVFFNPDEMTSCLDLLFGTWLVFFPLSLFFSRPQRNITLILIVSRK